MVSFLSCRHLEFCRSTKTILTCFFFLKSSNVVLCALEHTELITWKSSRWQCTCCSLLRVALEVLNVSPELL
jgi:hypothetical protein